MSSQQQQEDPSNPNSTAVFSLKTRKAVKEQQEQQQNQKKNEGEETVGEDELLTESDRKVKTAAKEAGDCTTRRRACKNCVCGRAEVEAKLIAEGKMNEDGEGSTFQPPVGGCGSCSKGDAFRCATCPFRGTAAWTETKSAATGAVQLTVSDDI